jgi:hypothetical protein
MNPSKVRVSLIVWIALLFGVLACPAHGQTWTYTGSMNESRVLATGTRLLDGRVLVAGGVDSAGNFLSSAEIYNPVTGTWTLTSPMAYPQGGAVAVLLNNGRVLVYGGGIAGGPGGVTNLAQVFDPVTGLWTPTGSMNQCRQSFTGTLLANGQAMAVGGYCGGYLSSTELYNPSTGTWSLTGSLPGPVANASATTLSTGKVLVAGGTTGFSITRAQLFDPNSGTWAVTGSLTQARAWSSSYALSGTILLNSGQVLAVGGYGGAGCGSFLSSAELYDPIAGTWAFTGGLSTALDQHRLVLLGDGQVLASGGLASDCTTYLIMAEIYDPSTGSWSAAGSLNQARAQHAAASLLDGRVLVAGGNFGSTVLNSAEVFSVQAADAPITATGAPFGATEGVTFTGTVATFTDPDPASTAGEYSATIDWGDGTPTTAGTISGRPGGPFTVSGTHIYVEQGTYTVTVTITDVNNPKNNATVISTARVGDAKLSSTCATMPVSTQTYSGPTAIFTDQSSTGTLSDFSATISWGDSSSSPGTITGGPGNAPYTVSGTHTYALTGTFLITTTIADVGGSTTTTPACSVTIFAFATGNGAAFVIGDLEAGLGNHVTWWSSQWAIINVMSGGAPPNAMKGFAGFEDNFLGLPPPNCGRTWSTDPGNSTPPPPSVPMLMGVIVSSRVTQSGSIISGDIKQVVIVRNDPGYAPSPGHPGTGTEIAIVCSLP